MKSNLRTLLVAAAIGAMALASAVACEVRDAGKALVRGAGMAVAVLVMPFGQKITDAYLSWGQRTGMVATLVSTADAYTGKYPIRATPPDADVLEIVIPFNMPAANPANGDYLQLLKLPAGVKIVDWMFFTDDCDSNGAPTIAYTFGNLNDPVTPTGFTTSYKTGITTLQNASVQRCDTTSAQLESSAAIRYLGIGFTAAAATYVAGKTGTLVLKLADY